ncbi:MAG: hypothetical protein JNJ65_11925 [Cyclobacteriaceae bacterium]|nr:hypothetical protein [Cyclobacteriaceae bacterium]
MQIRNLVFSADLKALREALQANPECANEEFSLPDNPGLAHPLHRICDGVSGGFFPETTGLVLAKLFFEFGARLDTQREAGQDSPLTAACSLRCDQLALEYIKQGARIDHPGVHGGTALHWAAWCGRDVVVEQLVKLQPNINQLCIDFKSTPLLWAVHGHCVGAKEKQHHQFRCAQLLLAQGADPTIPNIEGYRPAELIAKEETAWLALLQPLH